MSETQNAVKIIKAWRCRFDGIPHVEVEPFRIVVHSGRTLEVTEFYKDGCVYVAQGRHVRKNGEYAKGPRQGACIGAPDNVKAAIAEVMQGESRA